MGTPASATGCTTDHMHWGIRHAPGGCTCTTACARVPACRVGGAGRRPGRAAKRGQVQVVAGHGGEEVRLGRSVSAGRRDGIRGSGTGEEGRARQVWAVRQARGQVAPLLLLRPRLGPCTRSPPLGARGGACAIPAVAALFAARGRAVLPRAPRSPRAAVAGSPPPPQRLRPPVRLRHLRVLRCDSGKSQWFPGMLRVGRGAGGGCCCSGALLRASSPRAERGGGEGWGARTRVSHERRSGALPASPAGGGERPGPSLRRHSPSRAVTAEATRSGVSAQRTWPPAEEQQQQRGPEEMPAAGGAARLGSEAARAAAPRRGPDGTEPPRRP